MSQQDSAQPRLIGVFSLPRSGSTWVGKLFDSHPDTLYRHEPDSEGRLRALPFAPEAKQFAELAPQVNAFTASLRDIRTPRTVGKMPLFPKSYQSDLALRAKWLALMFAQSLSKAGVRMSVPEFVPARANPIVVWKSIESTARLGLIAKAAPAGRFVHLIRHPCGYVNSVTRGMSQHRFDDSYDPSADEAIWKELLATQVAQRYDLNWQRIKSLSFLQRLTWRWVIENENAMSETSGSPHVRTFCYEELCKPNSGLPREMLAFAGLDWHQAVQQFLTASTTSGRETKDYYSVFKDPLVAANQWRKKMTDEDIKLVLDVASNTGPGRLYKEEAALKQSGATA